MYKRVVVLVVSLSLVLLPAALSATDAPTGLPPFIGCHGELSIEKTGDTVSVKYDETKLYQRYTYYVKSWGGGVVCRISVIELRHTTPEGGAATKEGLRNPDSTKKYYRVEYSTTTKRIGPDGEERDAYIDVYSGPEGYMVEIMTVIPVGSATTVEGETPVKTTNL